MIKAFSVSLGEDEIENLARMLRSLWHSSSFAILSVEFSLNPSLDGRHLRPRKPHRQNRTIWWISKLNELLAGCYGSFAALVGLEVHKAANEPLQPWRQCSMEKHFVVNYDCQTETCHEGHWSDGKEDKDGAFP